MRRLFLLLVAYRQRCIRRTGLQILRQYRAEWKSQRASFVSVANASKIATEVWRRAEAR